MKNRTSNLFVTALVVLAVVGILGSFFANPAGFLQRIAVFILVGATIYFVIRRLNRANPEKRDQRAFLKAAKRSKKRFQHKDGGQGPRKTTGGELFKKTGKGKKKTPAHLTVIEGKKGKKKNRASF